jgi:hypothetical protein
MPHFVGASFTPCALHYVHFYQQLMVLNKVFVLSWNFCGDGKFPCLVGLEFQVCHNEAFDVSFIDRCGVQV